jgi:2,4-dienoyl-CoA reductase-like NADH-dependent reductase (Old Yellow Enzyme family)
LAGWKRVAEAVHAAGGRVFPQLWHVGSARKPNTPPYPEAQSVGPSGLIAPGKKRVLEMSDSDIADVIAAYAKAAKAAQALQFDGIELHGAHGYLIDQFFWSGTNERALPWGGDMVARTHFAAEVVRAVRREVGADFPICLRFSQWKLQDFNVKLAQNPGELAQFLAPLVDAGVDLFHASTRRFWLPEFDDSPLNLAGWTKKLTGKPVITVGSVGLDGEFQAAFAGQSAPTRNLDDLVERFERGEFDLVAVGRAVLQDPTWVEKLAQGRFDELRAFDPASMRDLY